MSRVRPIANWTAVPNTWLRDKNLSAKALGILVRMNSLPPDWEFSIKGLAAIMKEGVDSIRSALSELEKLGYIKREGRERRPDGTLGSSVYVILENPTQNLPMLENPTQVNPTQYNKDIHKKELLKKDILETKVSTEQAPATYGNEQVNRAFELFEEIVGRPMANTQANRRAAWRFMTAKTKGEDWLKAILIAWRESEKDQYAPRFYNFSDLTEAGIGKLRGWAARTGIQIRKKMNEEQKSKEDLNELKRLGLA